jgi:hypothetical protein
MDGIVLAQRGEARERIGDEAGIDQRIDGGR